MTTIRLLHLLCCMVLALLAGSTARAQPTTCGTENLLAGKTPYRLVGVQGSSELITDGAVSVEGARWDAPTTVRLENTGSSITFDLGQVRRIEALYIQADANDVHRITGSIDGTPGSFRLLAEVESVVGQGHGLRARAIRIPAASVRYLQLGDSVGDGAYSVTELAAYCKAPNPFPPAFASSGAERAQLTGPTASELDSERDDPSVRFGLLALAGVLAAIGLFVRGKRRAGPAKTTKRRAKRGRREHAALDAASVGSPPPPSAMDSREAAGVHRITCALFVASGAAALIYEVVWVHLLRLVIGASALSVGIVLASFMGGMFLGSLLFARLVNVDRAPLKVYAALELGIGVFGLAMPAILPAVRFVYVELFGYGPLGIGLRAVIAAVLLLPPTALMGATLPAIARRYSRGRRGTSALASLYAANTLGAVLGSLLAAFYLLAVWDVWIATLVAAVLNFAVGYVALRLSRGSKVTPIEPAVTSPAQRGFDRIHFVYLAAALSGMSALGAQVVWTRLLTLLFGATVYAFAIILAVFLASLGLGSALAARALKRGADPVRGLAWTQIALIPALLWASFLLGRVLPFASPPALTPIRALHVLHVIRAAEVILPAALAWGMSFPFALAAAARSSSDTGRSSGHVYAANTVGAILGALAISFWVIPAFGTQWAGRALTAIAALSAAVSFQLVLRLPNAEPRRARWRLPALPPAVALAAGAAAVAVLPGPSVAFLAHGRYVWWVDPRDRYPYVSEGAASTVAVHVAPSGYANFHVSGRVEATNNPNDLRLERLLGHLSALAHPNPKSVLVVGLGAGITAGSFLLHPSIQRIVICEIEPRVIGAARQFAPENYGVLDNPRVEVVFDDARHFLATTREQFDIVTSDPIHPWVRGNSILFSREYYRIVRDRLRPGGIATQWVPLYETSEQAIQMQMRTFMDAFPEGTVWNSSATGNGYDVVLLGSQQPLKLDLARIQVRMERDPKILESLREVRIGSAVDLAATYATRGRDMQRWLGGTQVNRDFSLKLEYISGLALNRDEADPIYRHMTRDRTFPENVIVGAPAQVAEARRRIERREVMPATR